MARHMKETAPAFQILGRVSRRKYHLRLGNAPGTRTLVHARAPLDKQRRVGDECREAGTAMLKVKAKSPCPCGSGKLFESCHGAWASSSGGPSAPASSSSTATAASSAPSHDRQSGMVASFAPSILPPRSTASRGSCGCSASEPIRSTSKTSFNTCFNPCFVLVHRNRFVVTDVA